MQRELNLASRRRGTYWTRVVTAALVGGILFAMAGTTNEAPFRVSQTIFRCLTVFTFAYCLFAGVRYTADALSEERREGTLGLLFLTDLRGYDVVIGKLAVTSLNAFFGLLAAIPLLAVPVMMGGVSMGEFWRITFVLMNTLLFSLAVGLAVSAFGVNERNVMLATLLCISIATFGLPFWWYGVTQFTSPRWLEFLLLFPSPIYALKMSASGLFLPVVSDFWPCMFTIGGISLASIGIASLRVPHSFQEPNQALKADGRRSRRYRLTFGNDFLRAHVRMQYLHRGRPYLWRVSRDRTMVHHVVLLTLVVAVLSAFSMVILTPRMLPPKVMIVMFCWLAVHWLIKILVATEACRPFHEDKRSGALELLLCTPLGPGDMIKAQRRRGRQLFVLPILLVCGVNLLIAASVHDRVLSTVFYVGALTLLPDCWALRWTGMHYSLVCRSFTRAVFATLWRVMVPSWLGLFLPFFALIGSKGSESTMRSFLVVWGFGSVIYDFFLIGAKRFVMSRDFRHLAADDTRASSVRRASVFAQNT